MKQYSGYVTVKFKDVVAKDEEWLKDWLEAQIETDYSLEIDEVVVDFEEPFVPIEEGK